MKTSRELMQEALERRLAIPAFNIPYLPMMEPVVEAVRDCNCLAMIAVARLEWIKFESGSPRAVRDAYREVRDPRHTRLHLDHTPVIDEDGEQVDYLAVLRDAVSLGYDSVMVDGSRLPLEENIAATGKAVQIAHRGGIPIEAELGKVLGHEEGPLPPYDELFESGRGFTDVGEAKRFVAETEVDWLSVAVGSIHGAISAARKDEKKPAARLDIEHISRLAEATGRPLVLHGGSGIPSRIVREAIANGITKINVGTAIRQPYERARKQGAQGAAEAVYDATTRVIRDELHLAGTADVLEPDA